MLGLLDSGAQCCVAGGDFNELMKSLNIEPVNDNSVIRTADGTSHAVNFSYNIPIKFNSIKKYINIVFVPAIPKLVVLGMDFWRAFKIRPRIVSSVECEKAIHLSLSHKLSTDLGDKLQSILKSMPFSKDGKLSKTHLITHRIDTGNASPIKQRHYIVSPYVQKDISEEIDRLLALDVIEPCEPGAWSSPIVVVKKASGKVRLCLDARRLNDVTIKDAYRIESWGVCPALRYFLQSTSLTIFFRFHLMRVLSRKRPLQ